MNLKQLQEERSKVRSALHKLKEKKGADTAGTVRLLREKMHAIQTRLRVRVSHPRTASCLESNNVVLSLRCRSCSRRVRCCQPPAINSAPYSSHFGGAGAVAAAVAPANRELGHQHERIALARHAAQRQYVGVDHVVVGRAYSSRSRALSSSIVTVHPSGIPVAPRPASRSFISYPL